MDEQLEQKLKEAHEGIFSFFNTFDEQIDSYKRTVIHAKDELLQSKLCFERLMKLASQQDPTLYVWCSDGNFNEKRKSTIVNFLLPKTLSDYVYGIKLFVDDKTWYNFKCIFSPWMVFPTLKLEAELNDNVLDIRNVFDITLIQTKEEYIEGSDVVRYVRQWLKKYLPGQKILVQYLN